jgi:hypothetical protein
MVSAAEDALDCVGFGLVVGELMRPRSSIARIRAGAGVFVLGIARGLFVFSVAPVIPAGGRDLLGQFTVEERDAGVSAPGPAEKGALHVWLSRDDAVAEDESEWRRCRS